ncbi:MAG: family 78 glycoside hydrolase catalytic domain, partial [Lachnospiraceae bacterium]|nr:family 78 glycoside hydrolase catalytic domain [Lachnospiraceae bacterium]
MTNNTKKERTGFSGWMTIPEWSSVRQVNVFGREREAEKLPRADAPENLHVLVRGVVDLPVPGKISGADASGNDCGTEDVALDDHLGEEYELLVAADDHYQLWIDGVYQGQGPAASCPERCYYDRYSIVLPTEHLKQPPSDREMKSDSDADCKSGFYTVTIALHLYYHGRISRSWTSGDGRFGLWVSVRRKENFAAHEDGLPDEPQKELAHCDESWRYQICTAYSGETVGYDTQFLENFDSRLWPEGWEQLGYNVDNSYNVENGNNRKPGEEREDGAMVLGTNVMKPWGHLVPALWADYTMMPRPIRMLEERVICPRRRWEKVDKSTGLHPGRQIFSEVFDFGQEITGAVLAEATGSAGAQVVIRYGEELEEAQNAVRPFDEKLEEAQNAVQPFDEELEGTQNAVWPSDEELEEARYTEQSSDRQNGCIGNQSNVRWNMRCGCAYQEIWTLGEGISHFHPYDYKGFRYVQLIYPETVKVQEVRAWVRHYPMEEDACTLKGAGFIQKENAR